MFIWILKILIPKLKFTNLKSQPPVPGDIELKQGGRPLSGPCRLSRPPTSSGSSSDPINLRLKDHGAISTWFLPLCHFHKIHGKLCLLQFKARNEIATNFYIAKLCCYLLFIIWVQAKSYTSTEFVLWVKSMGMLDPGSNHYKLFGSKRIESIFNGI